MTTTKRRINLDKFLATLKLEQGSHQPDHTFCVMEAVAYVAGEKWSDQPECASPVLTSFCVAWNDGMNDEDRQMLKPFIPRLAGSKNPDLELQRSYMAFDWQCRVSAPTWLRLAGLEDEARAIEACAPITDKASAQAATVALQRGAEKARAAGAAARDAAWAAARDAAWAAARAAAGAAARDAAWAAAWAAAGAAAWDAARAAAGDALRPTVAALQASALQLLDDMLKLGEAVAV